MYGHFFTVFRRFIVEMQGGESVWQKIVSQAKCDEDFEEKSKYDDDLIETMIKLAVDIIGLPKEPLLQMLGEFYFGCLREKGYEQLLKNLGSNILEFLQNLDSVHCLARNDFPKIVAPSFRCEDDSVEDRMVLHYYSPRKGLHSVVKGFTVAVAKVFYGMHLKMELLSVTTESVAEHNGDREHATFNIIARKIKDPNAEGPPTFIAQTKKHSEQQILQEDVEAVKRKLEQIKNELGEDALPLVKKKTAKAKWRLAARITAMHKGFVPNYPQSLAVNPRMFIEIFPFHLIFDTEMKVVQAGIKIQMMMPTIRSRQALMTDFFELRYPNCVDLAYKNVEHFILTPFILEMKKDSVVSDWKERPALQIKGQMFLLRDSGYFMFIASPLAKNWEDMENRKMKLAEIPIWDVTRDFLVTDLEYRKHLENNLRHNLTVSNGDRSPSINAARPESIGTLDDSALRNRLQITQRELDNERRKATTLYRAFLPRDVVDLVNRGHVPSGEFHVQATALFCDVVQFLPMVARCVPAEVVDLLNKLQTRFDDITKQFDTYRVESIGDAYLVVSGVGNRRDGHAERIANTALGMITASVEVTSPLDGEPLMIRIGVHTGSLVTGVIGQRVPRFVVMGETSVIASKLESHGEAGKIHVSPTTYRALLNKEFVFAERGLIELRGFGELQTYFLVGVDQPPSDLQAIEYLNESRQDGSPFEKRNKVHPIVGGLSPGGGATPASCHSEASLPMACK